MMQRVFPAVIIVLATAAVDVAAQRKEKKPLVVGRHGKAMAAWLAIAEKRGFSGAVLAATKGKVVAALAAGFADADKKKPNTPATLFEIASFSKQITAAAAVRAAQRRKLDLDESIAKRLPDIPEACKKITLRHLLQNTSGIPGTNAAGGGDDVAKVIPTFLAGGPQHEPGTHFEYWNQGWALATEIVARAVKMPFTDYCKKELFARAKMKSTCFTGDQAPKGASVAIGRSRAGAPRSALEHPYGSFGFQYRGMGGVVTNVWDLWRWDRALDGTKVLNKNAKAALFKPGLGDYALGWFVKEERGHLVQSHSGGVRGFICVGRRYPKHDACIFVLSNDDKSKIFVVANALEQALFGGEITAVYPDQNDVKSGAFLVGEYVNDKGDKLTIEIARDQLAARVDWKAGKQSRMLIARDKNDAFAVFVNTDRYDLDIKDRSKDQAKTLGLWGRTFRRVVE